MYELILYNNTRKDFSRMFFHLFTSYPTLLNITKDFILH